MNSATLSSATASTPSWPSTTECFFPTNSRFQRLDFRRRPVDEEEADAKALELLKNSPYKEKLANVGLFLKALQQRAPELPSLIRPIWAIAWRRAQASACPSCSPPPRHWTSTASIKSPRFPWADGSRSILGPTGLNCRRPAL